MAEQIEEEETPENTSNPNEGIEELLNSVKEDVCFITKNREVIKEDIKLIQQTRIDIEGNKDSIAKLLSETTKEAGELKTIQVALKKRIDLVQKRESALSGICAKIENFKNSAENDCKSINDNLEIMSNRITEFENLQTQAQTDFNNLSTTQNNLSSKIEEINKNCNEINTFHQEVDALHSELLYDELDDDDNITKESLSTQIKNQLDNSTDELKQIQETHSSIEGQFYLLKETLEKEIRSLLPGAGAAGLAHSYFDSKSRYGIVPNKEKNKTSWDKVSHFIGNRVAMLFHYILFIAPISYIVYLFAHYLSINGQEIEPTALVSRFLISLPLVVLSWFGNSSIRLNRRLYEEYNHKQRVMELYHSFKKEIDKEGTEEQKRALLQIMLTSVQDKPSLTMPKYDGNPFKKIGASFRPDTSKKEE